MKLAINLTREHVGGITSSNVSLINHLYGKDYKFLGIELSERVYMKGPVIFRNFNPKLFDHHIINIHHLPVVDVLKRSRNIRDAEYRYREPISIIRKIFKELLPDVVLLSGTYSFPWLISIAAKQEKIPIILWYSGVLAKETEHYPEKLRKLFCSIEKSLLKRASQIIFPSKLCKDVVEKIVTGRVIKNSCIIPNPIANVFTDPIAIEYSAERKIAAVGRYSKIKNFDKFFALHEKLLERKWQHEASFLTNQIKKNTQALKDVNFLTSMNQEELKNFYISQGLIICPSKFETFGNVPMEAVCLGVPVLVSDKMGCAEILQKAGLENMIISFDDLDKVADRVQQLCGQSILPKQLSAVRKMLDRRYVSEKIRMVIKNIYNKQKNICQ